MRLFVALDLPDEVRRAIGELIAELRPKCRDARWVRPESMHLTLKFIGHAVKDDDAKKLAAVRAALEAVHSNRPVEMQFRGVGFFPNARRPRVVWCGVEASENLAEIAAGIERALEPLGIPREGRAFVPHMTLARLDTPHAVPELARAAEELQSRDFGAARETEFVLFESVLHRSGAEYRKIQTYPFVKGDA